MYNFQCSRLCNGGVKTRSVDCVGPNENIDASKCLIISKPNAIERCNTNECAEWRTSKWTQV